MNYKHLLIPIVLMFQVSYTQNLEIETSFNQTGYLYSKPGPDGAILAKFKRKEKCIVKDYLGRNHYKVKSSNGTGYVEGEVLNFTRELSEYVDDFEAIRLQEIKIAQKEKDEILRKRIEENELKKEEKELKKKKESDSMKNVYKVLRKKMKIKDSIKREQDSIFQANYKTECHFLRNEIDKFDKVRVVETDYYKVNSKITDFFRIKLMKYGNEKFIYFNFYADVGCVSPYKSNRSFVKIYLKNHEILTFFHSGEINCDNLFSIIGVLNDNEINRLTKSPIESIRIQGTESNFDVDLDSTDYKDFFIDKLKCLNVNK